MPYSDDWVLQAPDVSWVALRDAADEGFVVRDVSGAALDTLGYAPDAWRATPEFWLSITHADDRDTARRHMADVLNARSHAPLLVRWTCADGRSVPMEVHLAKVTGASGDVVGLHGVAVEALRWSRMQEELARSRENLAYASRRATLNGLATALVHEINQPLDAIHSNAEAARLVLDRSRAQASDIAAMLDDIIAAHERAVSIIARARGLAARSGAGSSRVAVDAVVAEACDLLAGMALMRGASIVHGFDVPARMVQGDRVELTQVVVNLVRNALDAVGGAPPGLRTVEIAVDTLEGAVVLSVTDSGPGIAADVFERVFDPLISTKPDGLGLGLDVASAIVASHGGRMWAGNNRDVGAHFVVYLPSP